MDRAEYIGKDFPHLHGKTALVRPDEEDESYLWAQFDDPSLGKNYTHTWVRIPVRDMPLLVELRW